MEKIKLNQVDSIVKETDYSYRLALKNDLKYVGFGMFSSEDGKNIAFSLNEGTRLQFFESKASDKAHQLGLKSAGWGKWKGKSGDVVAQTKGDKLVKVKGEKQSDKSTTKKQLTKTKKQHTVVEPTKKHVATKNYFKDEDTTRLKKYAEKIDYNKEMPAIKGVFAKMALAVNGEDVKFNEDDIKVANSMKISGNIASARIYNNDMSNKTAMEGFSMDPKDMKNIVVNNLDKLKEKIPGLNPQLKGGSGTEKSASFKTDLILSEVRTITKGSEIYSTEQIKNFEQTFGADISESEFYGPKLDARKPDTFIAAIDDVNKSIFNSMSKAGAPEKTRKYVKDMIKSIDNIMKNKVDSSTKLKLFNENLPNILASAYREADSLSPQEGATFAKDFGEVAVYYNLLSQGKEAYLPKAGNFPTVDIVIANEDPVRLEGISVKSATKKSASMGAAASAQGYLRILSRIDPKVAQSAEKMIAKHTASVRIVKTENVSDNNKKKIGLLQSIPDDDSSINFPDLYKNLNINDEYQRQLNNRIEYYRNKTKGKKNFNVLIKELVYRTMCAQETEDLVQTSDAKIPMSFANIMATPKSFDISTVNRPDIKDFRSKDKQTPQLKIKGDKIISASYSGGTLGLAYSGKH